MHDGGGEVRAANDSVSLEERPGSVQLAQPDVAAPRLPRSYLIAHVPFRAACELLDRQARNWNEEFQKLWVDECQSAWVTDTREALEEFLQEYESYCFALVESLWREGRNSSTWAPRAMQFPDCFRVGNIMLRVWRDDKLGLNMQRCFRALIDCRAPFIAFPLCAAFRCYNASITVQAVVPIERGRAPLYRGDGTADPLLHRPLHDYLSFLFEALNIVPHGVGAQLKHVGVEVYEGSDLRLYILNPTGLLPPVSVSSLGVSGPLRRWWHVVRGPPAHFMQPPTQVYERAAATVHFLLLDALQEVSARRAKAMVRIMHDNGLNVCLLGVVLRHLLSQPDDGDESRENLMRLIGTEMIARAARRVMYHQANIDRAPRNFKTANSYLARTVGALMDPDPSRFLYGLTPTLRKVFPTDGDDAAMQSFLQTTLRENALQITKRLCVLCCFVLNRGVVEQFDCVRSAHNFSSYLDENHESAVAAFMLDPRREKDATLGQLTSLILPYCINQHMRAGRTEEAMRLSRRIVAVRARTKQSFLYFEALVNAALAAAQSGNYEGGLTMLDRAQSGMSITPAVERGMANSGVAVAPPQNIYFLWGRISAAAASGFLRCLYEDCEGARDSFLSALGLLRTVNPTTAEHATYAALLPFSGLIETAARSSAVTIEELLTTWSQLRQRLLPSVYAANVCEQLAMLLFENNMYEAAAERLRDALEIVVLLLGDHSYIVGVLLNKLAFVYYTWDVKRFGLLCNCLLQFAETIMIETKGEFTVSHLCVVENIVMTLMMRGSFVAASRRLTAALQSTSRKTARIPRDHPVTVRLYETLERFKTLFAPTATVIIQRHWREYKRRLELQAVFEVNASLLQRVGRGMVRRRLMLLYSRSEVQLEDFHQRDRDFVIRNFSKPLLRASERLSRKLRNWNGEAQHYHLSDQMWDTAAVTARNEHYDTLEREFHTKVLECIDALRESPHILTPVRDCTTSFVMDNIVITRVATDDVLPRMQNTISALLRRSPTAFFTAGLTDYVEVAGEAYLAQALIPIHRRPQVILGGSVKADQKSPKNAVWAVVDEAFWLIYGHSSDEVPNHTRGIEIVGAMDGLWYLTNCIGFIAHMEDRLDEFMKMMNTSPYQQAIQLFAVNQQAQAVTLIEQFLLSRKWKSDVNKFLAQGFLAYCCGAAGDVKGAAFKRFQVSAEVFERIGLLPLAGWLYYQQGRFLIRMGEYALAIKPLMEQHRALKAGRYHAYYAAHPFLENALWLGRACRNAGRPINRGVITFTLHAATHSEPMELLFETCAVMTQYCLESGELKLAEEFAVVRERKAKELDKASSLRYAKALLEHSQLLFKRGERESCEVSASLLTAAIRIVEAVQPDSLILGIMLNNYGSLLTQLKKLPAAKKTLLNAQRLLRSHLNPEHQEMISWRKNMNVLESRLRRGAALRIQRAVRRWLERRAVTGRLEEEDPERYISLLREQLLWRLRRLAVAESTTRVFIADEENEAFYVLQYKQRRRLGAAKVSTILRETYSARMHIHEEKLMTSLAALVRLEEGIRKALLFLEQGVHATLFTEGIWGLYRSGRRAIIRENHAMRIGFRLCRIDSVQTLVRSDMLRAHSKLLLYLVSSEETVWRKHLRSVNRQQKRALGINISRMLKPSRHSKQRQKRRKNPQRQLEDLLIEEQVRRDGILSKEAVASHDFFFGPLVDSEDDSSETSRCGSLRS
ncbi:hypothetical protein DQ04_00951070 [Trypanosoma grayi]|uniref:hypothetical protein n=1 Tax=Trypanosoma grayi TaxID=71804 RepID=UPI0004F40A7C|nr:hypothetical protein DQ04_00951070 [Trypanosoma grayi]KEG13531.1 hypothetical protein DQ04_00951070 [Trypanosoma grayi]